MRVDLGGVLRSVSLMQIFLRLLATLCAATLFCLSSSAEATKTSALPGNEIGVFDFNLRGGSVEAKLASVLDHGFDGLTVRLLVPQDLHTLDAYRKARPGLKVYAGFTPINFEKPEELPPEFLQGVLGRLSALRAKYWIIIYGPKDNEAAILALIRRLADEAKKHGVEPCLYPHAGSVMESAEEALVLLKKADRPNLTLTVHLCHELRAGNGHRIEEVVRQAKPWLSLATISGADTAMRPNTRDWSDAIKPLGEGDYDASRLLRVLAEVGYSGPIILHTFGLQKKPATHYAESLARLRAMQTEIATKNP